MKTKVHNIEIPKGFKIKYGSPKVAYGAETWRKKGGMTGGSGGSSRGVTSGNGIGTVPAAFFK
jgi:hypothetical protein